MKGSRCCLHHGVILPFNRPRNRSGYICTLARNILYRGTAFIVVKVTVASVLISVPFFLEERK